MRSSILRAVGLAALALGCGAGTPGESPAAQGSGIVDGTLDHDHPAVFQEYTRWDDSLSACTATLISANVLLTARHCVARGNTERVECDRSVFGDAVKGPETVFTNDAVPAMSSTYYHGVDVRVPAESNSMCGFDVALVILQSPVPASVVTPIVPRIDRAVEQGEAYVAVGYGVDEKGEPNPGRMVRGDLDVACTPGECRKPYGVATTEFMGDTGICSGDSGGPALDVDGKVIGVASRGADPCETPIYGQVAPWRDFITSTVLEAAEAAGIQPPFWAYSGSSDLPADVVEVGGACDEASACYPGSVCYLDAGAATPLCKADCANDAQCGDHEECRPGYDVQGGGLCFKREIRVAPDPEDEAVNAGSGEKGSADDSCAMSPRRGGAGALSLFGVLLALGGARLGSRARRRAATKPDAVPSDAF